MTSDAERARQRDLVRRGYDAISVAYRSDAGKPNAEADENMERYADWIAELSRLVPDRARVLDLGCGAGLPATRALVEQGFRVTGLDFSAVQLRRARTLVPGAAFIQADMTTPWAASRASWDAVVSFYALIHVPLADQPPIFRRIRGWLSDGGYFLATLGHRRWTGTEDYMGAPMFWDHADTETYLRWLSDAHLEPVWHRFVPEGASGHTLVLARAA
ncbi:MAG: hypothetical protein QOJ03_2063 [Frankiaceae bacterium]|nr:hypothetical protein [Frankiaceae bacterium]